MHSADAPPMQQLRVTVPAGLVEVARQHAPNLSLIVRRALAEVAGVSLDDFPTRPIGRPRKHAGALDGEAAA